MNLIKTFLPILVLFVGDCCL